MRRLMMLSMLALVALGASAEALAEVRVVLDRNGSYQMTRIALDARTGRVWSAAVRGDASTVLNERGDVNGDLYPRVQESSLAPYHPWVVWSRFNLGDERYDLAWSRWDGNGWQPVRWLDPQSSAGDNLDADLRVDVQGRPYVVWWRDEQGDGRVYLSVFLATEWMAPYAVSPAGLDSRDPSLRVETPGVMVVTYETPHGTVQETVVFDAPVTITDDINPLDYVHSESRSIIGD